jgi:hypothetical protein
MKPNQHFEDLFLRFNERSLRHRYISNQHIEPLLKKLADNYKVDVIGTSVNDLPIYAVTMGTGKKRVLMWSQMHGNESTTTKALFDLFNCTSDDEISFLVENCQLCIIPILNPDGAKAYTRLNANKIDLNRDAQDQSQPESKVLRTIFDNFRPDYCFNLHGQRTIFSAGINEKPATISFLAPAQDAACTITPGRKVAMDIIVSMNKALQLIIPDQIGIYDDSFNINCVGDTFQSNNVPTILFEAGHFFGDYNREVVRKYMFIALITALRRIAHNDSLGDGYEPYFDIPENKKLYYDILLRNARLLENGNVIDIAIQYHETLINNKVEFVPKVERIGKNLKTYGHLVIQCDEKLVTGQKKSPISEGTEIDFVHLENEIYSLKLHKS